MGRLKRSTKNPAHLPTEFKNRVATMGGTKVELVTQTKLYKKDMKDKLSIPSTRIRTKFLTPEEEIQLDNHRVINALLTDPSLNVCCLSLSKWKNSSGNVFYSLINNWSFVLNKNARVLKRGALVQLWSFRCSGQLRFALVKIDGEEGEESSCSSEGPLMPVSHVHNPAPFPAPAPTDAVVDEQVRVLPTLMRAGYMAYIYLMTGDVPSW